MIGNYFDFRLSNYLDELMNGEFIEAKVLIESKK